MWSESAEGPISLWPLDLWFLSRTVAMWESWDMRLKLEVSDLLKAWSIKSKIDIKIKTWWRTEARSNETLEKLKEHMLKYTPREEVHGSKAAGRRVKKQLSLSKHRRKGRQVEPGWWGLRVHAHTQGVSHLPQQPHSTQPASALCEMGTY